MRERSGLLAAMLGISAVLFHSGSAKQVFSLEKNSAAVSSAEAGQDHAGDWELLKNLDEFYILGAQDAAGTELNASSLPGSWWKSKLENRFDWLIATVPDPERTEQKLNFDREVASIQNAVESAGYHFDRYWFPWKVEEGRATAQIAEQSKSSGADGKRKLPGMLLFRAMTPGQGRDFLVFLVGETPTSGMVPEEFENAMRFGELSRSEPKVNIAGPGFSGSFSSLGKLMAKYPAQEFRLRSWSSDLGSQNDFEEQHGNAVLATTTGSSFDAMKRFCSYLRTRWNESGPIVLLVEESTAFGSGLTQQIVGAEQGQLELERADHAYKPRGGKRKNAIEETDLSAKELAPIYVVKFPRGIARLRNATEDKEQIPGFAESSKGTDALRRELPFTLKDDQIGSSELPFYSKQQSPVSQEAVLLSISTLLKKSSLHYAGIIASDPLDLLFLSKLLRSASPNTRLFTEESDLLFQHGSDGSDYQGILTVTNYPLIPFNQIWTHSNGDGTVQIFPSGHAESVYNAVVQLLGDAEHPMHLREYADPFAADFDKGKASEPPLWITVASGNGYAPVDVLEEDPQRPAVTASFLTPVSMGSPAAAMSGNAPRWVPEYWASWGYAFGIIGCLCLLYGACLVGAHPTGNRVFAIFSVKPSEPKPLRRALWLSLIGLLLAMLVAMWLAVPYIALAQNAGFLAGKGVTGLAAGVLLEVCSGVALVVTALLLVRGPSAQSVRWAQGGGFAFLLLTAALLGLRALGLHAPLRRELVTALHYGTLLLAAAAVPVAAAELEAGALPKVEAAETQRGWRRLIGAAGLLVLVLTILSWGAPACLQKSSSLLRLWGLLYGGAAVLGVTISSALIPFADAVEGLRQQARNRAQGWLRVLMAEAHFWVTALLAAGAACLLAWTAMKVNDRDPHQFLAACRALNLTSGVCPLAPLTLSLLALAFWSFIQLRRTTDHEDRCPSVPDLPEYPFCPGLQEVVEDVKKRIAGDFFHPVFNFVAIAGAALVATVYVACGHQTLESMRMDKAMVCVSVLVAVSIMLACARLALIWSAFREFLQQLERHPLRQIFSCLPRGFLWAPMWQGGGKKRTHVAITRSLECVRALVNSPATAAGLSSNLTEKLPHLTELVKEVLQSAAARKRISLALRFDVQRELGAIGTAVATELQTSTWTRGGYECRSELSTRETMKRALRVSPDEFKVEEPNTIGSELLALRFIPFVNYVLMQLQNLALYLSVAFILLVGAMNCYVFRARTVIECSLAVLFVLLGGTVATVFSQLDRDAIFSRITRTEEGKLDRNFLLHLISYGGVPTLALLASHVPTVAKFFFSWIKPAMEAIH